MEVIQESINFRDVELEFRIPKSTLHRRIKGLNKSKMVWQTSLSRDEESIFMDHLIAVSNWGFFFSQLDF